MMNFFVYDGKNSQDLGLLISGEKIYNSPSRDVTTVSIPGRSGDLIIDNGRYNNIEISYTVSFRKDVPEKTRALKAWLLSKVGYRRLEDTYQPEYFRLAAISNATEFEISINRYGTAELIFNCNPFLFSKGGEQTVLIPASGGRIYNPEYFVSQPIITVYGNGDGVLSVNNINYNISAIDGYVTINSDVGLVYKGLENKNSTVNFIEFPTLQVGENIIDWTGGITKVEIIPRWCTL
jgi:phage-related protein|nr:MAG TPA: distal tail protein [Caudoviricetes sp.]